MRQMNVLEKIGIIVLLLSFPVLLLVGGFLLPVQYEETFLGELKYKYEKLHVTEGKRIILIGGSSVAFGADSRLIAQEFPEYEVVNFGMYAALGTKVMLDLSKDAIREGDIVLIIPEQQEQTLSEYFNGAYFWQAADGAFPMLLDCERKNWGELAAQFPYFAAEKWKCFLTGNHLKTDGIYAKASFHDDGDIVTEEVSCNIMPGGYDPNMPVRFEAEMLTEAFAAYMNEYAKEAMERGAVVWYHFCPMNAAAIESDSDVDAYYDSLQERLDFPIAGNPNDCIMDAAWFYDTNFHLNVSGKTVYTRQLVRDIKAMLGDCSLTAIEIPQMPELSAATGAEEAFPDAESTAEVWAEYFLWKVEAGEVCITGLTQAGKKETELIVPAFLEGLPVTRIKASAFAGNTSVKRITIGENIALIEDGAFTGCVGLKELILPWESPGDCMVGQGLLEGTKAKIVVPKQAVNAYKVDYTWSVYADCIKAAEE